MPEMSYLNFDLKVKHRAEGGYRAEVTSPGGDPKLDFELPFTPAEIDMLRQAVHGPVRDTRRPVISVPGIQAESRAKLRIFGERLYDSVFADSVRASLATSLQAATQQSARLRIRLHLEEVPELADLPWEYLYNRDSQTHLALQDQTPLVRYMALAGAPSAVLVKPPINILVMISDPQDYPRLEIQLEWDTICAAFKDLIKAELVTIERLEHATLDELQNRLNQSKRYHVFHFIGHGGFDPVTGEAVLLMEDANGRGNSVGIDLLNVALDHFSLRMVVLNSCEGARAGGNDPFAGLAQSLVRTGKAAVIAMQFRITDTAAITFADNFYRLIADNQPVDAALTFARKKIFMKNLPEWGTPVLFMRAPDGRIFQIDRPTAEQVRQHQIEALSRDAHTALENKDYATAIQKLQAILAL